MTINEAKNLAVNQVVYFPTDRGDPAGMGTITHIGDNVSTNIYGVEYLWVTVRYALKNQSGVWPSNRLVKGE